MIKFKKKLREELTFSNGVALPQPPPKKRDIDLEVWKKLYDLVKNETGIKLDVETLKMAMAPFDDEVLPDVALFKLLNVAMKGYIKLDSTLRTILQYMELLGILNALSLDLNGPQRYIVDVNPEL